MTAVLAHTQTGRTTVDVVAMATTEVPELYLEDCEVVIRSYPAVVVAGIGATVWAHPGVVVDAQPGSVVHLAPGAQLLEERPGALERGEMTVLDWDMRTS